MSFSDTICATSTAQGVGALGIIRVSGKKSFQIVNAVFKGKNLVKAESHTIHYGFILDKKNKELIDEVMVSVFKAPKTFTAEDLVEINCHGSPYIQQQIINLLLKNGARLANAGEFTQRAFLNGRIDLTQAEAVADLIVAESKASHDLAINQIRGGFSSDLKLMREDLINFVALIELELDFSDEDVEFADRKKLIQLISEILIKIKPLIDSFQYGNAIKTGIPVAIIGKPNSGKSTLLNTLLNEERAIVSSVPGTTRDTIEEKITIDGVDFRFIDTAGIRKTEDEIELLGIEKSRKSIEQATIVIHLYDINSESNLESSLEMILSYGKFVLNVANKIDLSKENLFSENELLKKFPNTKHLQISAMEKTYISELEAELSNFVKTLKGDFGSNIVVNQRHWHELIQTQESLQLAKEGLKSGLSGDLISFHLRDSLKHLGNITGEIDIDEDILGTIFGKFCIGK